MLGTIMLCLLLGSAVAAGPFRRGRMAGSKHNLAAVVQGQGGAESAMETEICIFCHTSHMSGKAAPLWNRLSSGVAYIPYQSTTAKAVFGQPTGDSKLCLSCHDGTIALGLVRSRGGRGRGGRGRGGRRMSSLPRNRLVLGNDLADDHPISFAYDSALFSASGGQLADPIMLFDYIRLDKNRQLQCTTCHNPHDNQYGNFLVMNNTGSALCVTCHKKDYWSGSIHRTSVATWNGMSRDPWPHTEHNTVAANGCENCHTPHTAGTKPHLLNFSGEERNCYPCHSGNVAARNIRGAFRKFSAHPVNRTTGVHDATEDLVDAPRHVECADCHNPHAIKRAAASAPRAAGAQTGVTGIGSSGGPISSIRYEYELCYRCHGSSVNRGASLVKRQFPETNTRVEFDPSRASFHPVEAPGNNPDVPSLIAPLDENRLIYCTDCHNNDQGPGAGGTGPAGPHGSAYVPILERRLDLFDDAPYSTAAYALCYKCHDRDSILDDESFPEHNKHVREEQTACTTCHDPHGVAKVKHLVNFNLDYVTPSGSGRMEFDDDGEQHGTCYLTCHGSDHDPKSY